MSTYRFRVKNEYDPTSLWRDIAVGGDRTLVGFKTVLNRVMGLDQDHLWFFGTDQDYGHSDSQDKRPGEIDHSASELMRGGTEYDAEETTIGEMARQLDLDECDRLCYVFDHGDGWRFSVILTAIDETGSSDKALDVVNENGEAVEQYGPPNEAW